MTGKRRVLIAGASSDIGLALLRRLLGAGWRIGAHCRRGQERVAQAIAEVSGGDSVTRILVGDLQLQDDCHRLVDDFASWAGGIDALVQLTGDVAAPCPWEDVAESDWLADIAVNLNAPFFLAQQAFAHMRRSEGGRIVLMSTASASHGGGQDTLAYGVAKAGVECLTKGLARAGGPHNILVNALAPGLIDTRFHRDRLGRDEDAVRRRAQLVPLGRAGQPDDVARMAEYLLSAGGDFITGQILAISGGDWL